MVKYIRHFIAVGVGGFVAVLAEWLGLGAEEAATLAGQVTEGLSAAATAIWFAVYVFVEKFGKRFTGEPEA